MSATVNKDRMRNLSFSEREAKRALYVKAARMRKKMATKAVAAFLDMEPWRVGQLLRWPPMSEEQIDRIAEEESEYAEYRAAEIDKWREEARADKARWRAERLQAKHDEAREAKAASLCCLIEAMIEMRPYVGTEV